MRNFSEETPDLQIGVYALTEAAEQFENEAITEDDARIALLYRANLWLDIRICRPA